MKILAKVKEETDDLREQYAIVMSMDDPESLALVEEELGIKLSKILRTAEKKLRARSLHTDSISDTRWSLPGCLPGGTGT